ncbi:MAG: type II toxin-antitoxin system RelE/ParE family toxin [Acidobacteriia bacterium]|nr:type II toxin-antitoxin system RelE/ParE family toxin [Terriglobia bacterium]
MRVFKNKAFSRFADGNKISDEDLCDTVQRASRGLIDANLGGGVIKQRIARKGGGKSGGFRSMILFRVGNRAVFVHGFAKKDLGNINPNELKALKKLARIMLGYSDAQIATVVALGTLFEVKCNGKTVS